MYRVAETARVCSVQNGATEQHGVIEIDRGDRVIEREATHMRTYMQALTVKYVWVLAEMWEGWRL